ncbi:MAG: hypothetical protein CL927_08870 [Deltaproteobacteria bacterium]|nr:hypothetical protein [Deltaproteobacteria bacterium]
MTTYRILASLMLLVVTSGCFKKQKAALAAAAAGAQVACESAKRTSQNVRQNVDAANEAYLAAKQALETASRKGQRPKLAAKAALYDQAQKAVEVNKERLQTAQQQATEAASAEMAACMGD